MKIEKMSITTHQGQKLIRELSFSLNPGDKLAIIGEEGNGKSSLLKAIVNPEGLDYAKVSGKVYWKNQRPALLEQQFDARWLDQTALEYLLTDEPGRVIEYHRYNELSSYIRLLSEVGLAPELLEIPRPLASFSGGEKVKLRLVKLLAQKPDIWLLDEPTNDIDLATMEWLESFVQALTQPVIFISHDIVFLEQCANRILHLENVLGKQHERYTLFTEGYTEYVSDRQARLEKQWRMHRDQQRAYKQQLLEINEQKNKVRAAQIKIKDSSARRVLNKKMANILAVKDRLDKTERVESVHAEEAITFVLPDVHLASGQRVLELELEQLQVAGQPLTGPIQLQINGGEKVAIIGANGVGKTTLLKQIQQMIIADGRFSLAVFPQDYRSEFQAAESPMQYLIRQGIDPVLARKQLGSIRLTFSEMERPALSLSSGQQAKVILAKLVLLGAEVILADEPTRNVSPLSAPVIHDLFQEYSGSVISVSHDRRFIEKVADRVLELKPSGLHEIY